MQNTKNPLLEMDKPQTNPNSDRISSPPHQPAPTAPNYQNGSATHVVQPHRNNTSPNIIFRIGKYIPCIFILGTICWSWYAMVLNVLGWYYSKFSKNSQKKPKFLKKDYRKFLKTCCHFEKVGVPTFIILLIVYHIVLLLFIWSWFKTVWTEPWVADERYELTNEEIDQYYRAHANGNPDERNNLLKRIIEARGLTVCQRQDFRGSRRSRESVSDEIRFCRKTNTIKPDRAHYDSMTKKLVLKMDHYCPWVANCIGFNNYKFFVLFLFYAITYRAEFRKNIEKLKILCRITFFSKFAHCFTIIGISVKPFLEVWTGSQNQQDVPSNEPPAFRMQTILVFMVAAVFSLSVFFLFSFHVYLVSKNRTTIEVYGAPTIRNVGSYKNAYNIGCFKNWQQVMGKSILMWPIPVAYVPKELDKGHSYPLSDLLSTNQQIDVV